MNSGCKSFRTSAILAILLILSATSQGCTTFIVTPGASDDGSMYVGHTNDGYGRGVLGHNLTEDDTKVVYVPAADHPNGSQREVQFDPNSGSDEPTHSAKTDHPDVVYIPEVDHTYGYLTASYGIMNEHQLMCGECTDYAKVQPNFEPKKRIFYSSELSNIALERCTGAKEAVELVGSLIDDYGYYGTGETLLFADPKEAWVIEMCGYDPNACGTAYDPNSSGGGLWVAKKVDDGEVFAASNTFRIRDVNASDPEMLYSENLFQVAQDNGWWSPYELEGPLDWLKTVSTGEYSHPYYSLARVWSVYSRITPSRNFSPYVEDTWSRDYPFSVRPDEKLGTEEVLSIFRDHYEGTVFDLTAGMAAGPYGNPYRNRGPFDDHTPFNPGEIRPGAWPRPVSAFFCSYSYVAQGRSWLPDPIGGVCWFGFAQPYETCYIPIRAGVNSLPEEFSIGSRSVFDRNSAWWAFNFVTNWACLGYDSMIEDIQKEQRRIEAEELSKQTEIDRKAQEINKTEGTEACREFLTETCNENALSVLDDWWILADRLIVKYSNGMINDFENETTVLGGYPNWWLNETGYQYGPRIYQVEELRQLDGVVYVNETVQTNPGKELEYIKENQCPKCIEVKEG